jgi:hypothetical protein
MKTDNLIRLLASDHAAPRPDLRLRLGAGALIGGAASLVALLVVLGVRPDLAAALGNWRLLVKFAVAMTLICGGAALSLTLARPFVEGSGRWMLLFAAPLLLLAACAVELAVVPPHDWGRRALGVNALPCLISIPLLSVLPLGGIIWALREGAPASPAKAALAAGGMAAGIGAAIYALHCPDDSPLFLAIWYVLATALVMVAGRASGARLLRW